MEILFVSHFIVLYASFNTENNTSVDRIMYFFLEDMQLVLWRKEVYVRKTNTKYAALVGEQFENMYFIKIRKATVIYIFTILSIYFVTQVTSSRKWNEL